MTQADYDKIRAAVAAKKAKVAENAEPVRPSELVSFDTTDALIEASKKGQ